MGWLVFSREWCKTGLALRYCRQAEMQDRGEAGSGEATGTTARGQSFLSRCQLIGARGVPGASLTCLNWEKAGRSSSLSVFTSLEHIPDISMLSCHIIFKDLVSIEARIQIAKQNRICGYVLFCWKQEPTPVATEGHLKSGVLWMSWISESHSTKENGDLGLRVKRLYYWWLFPDNRKASM